MSRSIAITVLLAFVSSATILPACSVLRQIDRTAKALEDDARAREKATEKVGESTSNFLNHGTEILILLGTAALTLLRYLTGWKVPNIWRRRRTAGSTPSGSSRSLPSWPSSSWGASVPDGRPAIRVDHVSWRTAEMGHVVYEISYPDGRFSYMAQPFSRDGSIPPGWDKVWRFTGSADAMTLDPSYVCEDTRTGARVHLFLRAGKIELCGDSTVRVAGA